MRLKRYLGGKISASLGAKPFKDTQRLFHSLNRHLEEYTFAYLSASKPIYYNLEKRLKKWGFPPGIYQQKNFGSPDTYLYKKQTLETWLEKWSPGPHDQVILFGDNGEHDASVYQEIVSKWKNKTTIVAFIRDIRVQSFCPKRNRFVIESSVEGVVNYLHTKQIL